MKRVVYIFAMCSLAILARSHAEAQEQKTDSVEYKRDAIQKETKDFLSRTDSAMLTTDVVFLRNIDSASVNDNQKEVYKYLLLVLDLSEAIKVTEAEHQELLDLEKQCAEKKKELSSQVSALISTNNRIITTIKASKWVLSEEHRLFINKMVDRVRVLEKCYAPPSKPKKKRK